MAFMEISYICVNYAMHMMLLLSQSIGFTLLSILLSVTYLEAVIMIYLKLVRICTLDDKIIGHAGTALCWKFHSGCSRGCDAESDRFCVLRINIEQDVVLFIVSVYMPPANSNIVDFGVILDQLEEIVLSL